MTRGDIRVVLCGDDGVGKSTIITSLIKERFYDLPAGLVLPEISIPPEITPDITTHLIDTSSRPEERHHLESEIRKAHVVVIIYSIEDPVSFDRITTYWLPTIRSLGVNVPVILVGNKLDLRGGQYVSNEAFQSELAPLMREFKEVETCIECSAKASINISETFYLAQNAVLHPTAPLYDSREHVLKPACYNALVRIFKLSDVNKDGVLDDDELHEFQRKCFGVSLQSKELKTIKSDVLKENKQYLNPDGFITQDGFLFLHTCFIQKGRMETVWGVLRAFGYGDDLSLRETFLAPRFDVPTDCSAELSPAGYNFFTDLFEVFDKDLDGALNEDELTNLFSTSPGNPWLNQGFPETTVTNNSDAVTLQGWLAQWSMTTLLDPRVTLAYLAYLGYPSPVTSALTTTKPRKSERKKKNKVDRNTYLIYVFGAVGSGKSSICRNLVGKHYRETINNNGGSLTVVNSVEYKGAEKYLVVQEFAAWESNQVLRNSKKLGMADVLVFVYDSSDTNSFSYISNLRQEFKVDHMPTLFVASKADLDLAQQRHEVQPDVYCRKLCLRVPVAVSMKTDQTADLWPILCGIATNPNSSIPGGPDKSTDRLTLYLSIGAILGVSSALVIVAFKHFHNRPSSSPSSSSSTLSSGSTAGNGNGGISSWTSWLSGSKDFSAVVAERKDL
ncbi:P-loop containing nucleoside triphosphate hydrolase protein [Phakopsora pachyrhizi]|uniref:Mitochondrial Rho GTPase n=1 Tax=Phakopsora pachyrhizi TaxID=170000 RepID=A0AAV0BNV3_PHAPC|nr:P-loop containing nucleoside triphosphate hydrolase protein [Phakopsora pachyrhizi]KAI8452989.1 P-loop containing nucleoside triphosphate hydrolase protein [Phakopsora pachyrhizi]CAH7688982.1 P-loop containing nucleoside triphosphate hydrolase protein [Phakopsora pachyrhizi]